MKKHFPLVLRIIIALILIQTLRFKFTAHPDSVYIFEKVGLEPLGRIGFLETDYPRQSHRGTSLPAGRFRRFHFGLGTKNRPESFRDYILPHPELRKGNSDLPEGEVNSKTPR
tara:strand:- start:920 stop:1258 length:339 start_codon:yes stop_codon:yes gene_type:complete